MSDDFAEPDLTELPDDTGALQQAIVRSFEAGARRPDGKPGKARPHQVDAVAQLVTAVRQDCHAPHPPSYLLQHAAGSGKSLTIAALVAALLRTVDAAGRRFHTVLVVTDRLQLDQQLGDTLTGFVAGNGFASSTVARASSSSQLRSHLLTPPGTPGRPAVILTTIQKLASLWRNAAAATADVESEQQQDGITRAVAGTPMTLAASRAAAAAAGGAAELASVLGQGRVAIIADEAHRHHGNHSSEQISDILAAVFGSSRSSSGDSAAAAAAYGHRQQQQQLVIRKKSAGKRKAADMQSATDGMLMQQQPRFVTYFGFTATPGPRALQLFGVAQQVNVDVLGNVVTVQQATAAATAAAAAATAAAAAGTRAVRPTQAQHQQQQQDPTAAAAAAANTGGGSATQQQQQHQQQDPTAAAAAELHLSPATLYTPFHCYSLQHATADGLVLDVLQNFVAVTPRLQISGLQLTQQQRLQLQQLDAASRAAAEVANSNPSSSASKTVGLRDDLGLVGWSGNNTAAAAAAAGSSINSSSSTNSVGSLAEGLLIHAASNSRQLVMTKAEDIVQRFMGAWSEAVACGFTGFRAMVVVRSRQHVVWYCQEIRKLLQQYTEQIQQLLAAAGGIADMAAARAAAAGDMSPLCYGAFSGTVGVAAAEAEQLFDPAAAAAATAAAAAAVSDGTSRKRSSSAMMKSERGDTAAAAAAGCWQQQQQQRQRRVHRTNSPNSSGWDAALAAFDAEQTALQQQQQQQQDVKQEAAGAAVPQSTAKRHRGGTSSTVTSSSCVTEDLRNPNSTSSSSSSDESDYSMSAQAGSDGTSDSEVLDSSDSDTAAAAARGGDSDGLGDSWADATAAAAAAAGTSDTTLDAATGGGGHGQQQQQQQLASVNGRTGIMPPSAKKRPRRHTSTLSCNTSSTSATAVDVAAVAAGGGSAEVPGCSQSEQQQQQQQQGQDSDSDSVPLLQRRQLQQQQQQRSRPQHDNMEQNIAQEHPPRHQQQQQQTLAAAAVELLVPVSEVDLNAAGFSHADARLLVVCSKFETGYDDPRLGAIFIDRPLSGARAVQVLGRVNRPAPGKGSSILTAAATTAAAAEDASVATVAAAAASVAFPPPGFRVLVVDFVNSVGGIREAFSQFYGSTCYCTGSQAKRCRQQQTLDECLSRILEVLQPAAARQAAAAALAQRLHIQGRSTPTAAAAAAATSSSSTNDISGSLADMNVEEVCGLVAGLQPEVQRAVEDDLAQYCSLCMKLRLEKLEFPYVFAAAVHSQLATLRLHREKASSTGRFAWMEQLAAAAAPLNQQVTKVATDSPATAAAASHTAAAGGDGSMCGIQQQQHQIEAAAAAPVSAAAKLSHDLKSSRVAVDVVQFEETFAGHVRLNPADALKPLHSVKLSSHLSGGNNSHNKKNNSQGVSADAQVKAGRPLHEVIAAANAQLAGRFKKQVAAGLRELCDKLRDGSSSSSNATAAAAAAVRRPTGASNTSSSTAAAGTDARVTITQQQQQGPATGASIATDAAAAAAEQPACEQGDVYTVMSLLRRLQLWPVTAQLLKSTQAGKQVSGLAKTHSHPMVRNLAAQVVAEWKATLARQAMAAAAAKAREEQQQQRSGGLGSSSGKSKVAAAAASGIDEGLRSKVAGMMRDALLEHWVKVQQQQQQLGFDKSNVPASEAARLQTLATDLEQELHRHIMQLHSSSCSGNSTRTTAGPKAGSSSSSSSGGALQDYKKQARMLCTGLRYPDGVAVQLLAGERGASEVVRLDALALAPAAVQAAVAKRREEQRRSEAVWEELVSQSIGGGGTYVTTDVKCPQCGEKRAQVHTILSGGTYAQERQTIQKYVCKQCNFTWRSDS